MTEDEEGVESEELSSPRVMGRGNTKIDVDEGDEGQDEKEKKSSAERITGSICSKPAFRIFKHSVGVRET